MGVFFGFHYPLKEPLIRGTLRLVPLQHPMNTDTNVGTKSRVSLKSGVLVVGLALSATIFGLVLFLTGGGDEGSGNESAPLDVSGRCPGRFSTNIRLTGPIDLPTLDQGAGGGCFAPTADNLIIDGNGFTVKTGGGNLVYSAYGASHLTVKNIFSDGDIYYFGPAAGLTIDNVWIRGVLAVGGSDDAVFKNSVFTGSVAMDGGLRFQFTNNTVDGPSDRLVNFGGPGTATSVEEAYLNPPEPDSLRQCLLTRDTITDNTIINTVDNNFNNPLTFFYHCRRGGTIARNTIIATDESQGVFIRDGAHFNTFSDNIVRVNKATDGNRGAFSVTAGTPFLALPTYNTFTRNAIVADNAAAMWLQSYSNNNTYTNNIAWSKTGYGSQLYVGENNVFDHNTFYTGGSGKSVLYDSDPLNTAIGSPGKNTVTNNIFSNANDSILKHDHSAGYIGYVAHHNIYNTRSGAANFYGTMNLAQWKTTSGEQASSFESSPVSTSLFTNAATGDFSLATSSPARGAGENGSDIGAAPLDFNKTIFPNVTISSPAKNTRVAGLVTIMADATDTLGVTKVEFYQGSTLLGTDTTAPYSFDWNTAGQPEGPQMLIAKAYNGVNVRVTGNLVTVDNIPDTGCTENWSCGSWSACVNGTQTRTCTDANSCGTTLNRPALSQSCTTGGDTVAPTVSVTAPSNNSTVSGTTTIAATASDNVGVTKVEFIKGSTILATDTTAPFAYSWNTAAETNAAYTLTAKAYDAAANTASAAVNVTVSNAQSCQTWQCSPWGSCVNNVQSRSCNDIGYWCPALSRPPLTQDCTSCSLYNQISAPGVQLPDVLCAPRNKCNAQNRIQDMTLSATSIQATKPLTVTIKYLCNYNASDNVTLWYFDGKSWKTSPQLYRGPAPATPLTNCDGTTVGTITYTFTPNAANVNIPQYVRAIEAAGTNVHADQNICPDFGLTGEGGVMDKSFTVTPGGPIKNPPPRF